MKKIIEKIILRLMEKYLVSFGSYLLSKERLMSFNTTSSGGTEWIDKVHHSDLENWKLKEGLDG